MAARRNARVVEMQDFEKAKDKILMGPERKSMVMPEEERRNTAYHESGHALIGKLLPKCDPVHKVTIIPRGRALGVTMSLPAQDRYCLRQRLHAQPDQHAVRRPDCRGSVHEADDHGCQQ
jgi:cell division protease FtsH